MKIRLFTHSDWDQWLGKLLKVTQDYAMVQPLWIFGFEFLYPEHSIRPPLWVRA